jgi:hypothetical protein
MSSRKCMILTIEVSAMMPVDDRAKKPSEKIIQGGVPRARWHDGLSPSFMNFDRRIAETRAGAARLLG